MDEFKTQVLLLHSEQDTLDNLRSGFSDRYTVHCATSGSEALNTLVETPINVLISAQELPGMSGLDALREAKKRSPEMIGILLAGSASTDIEALVGDEEVFQVVSGTVTGEGLLQLVDNATRQMRLMALAESANDTTASMDMSAEHIVMETSENGSTIISDGTGRMPTLDPKKVAAAASVGSRAVDILVLTKDQEFLETVKDSSRGMHKVYYANTLGQANEAIREHKIGVAVVDAAMVGEKIEQLTQHLRKGSSRLVSIVAGRRDDGEMLMDLINRGKVYRFLLKPVSPGRARLAVEASVKHHLEAPDAAFKIKGTDAAPVPAAITTIPKPAAPIPAAIKVTPKPAAPMPEAPAPQKPVSKTPETPAPKPMPAAAPSAPADPPLGSSLGPQGSSPIEDGLADAFGDDDSSFTETVTGLISAISDKFSSNEDEEPIAEAPASVSESIAGSGATETVAESDGAFFRNPAIMGIGAAAVVVIAVAIFWFAGDSDEAVVQPAETGGTPTIVDAEPASKQVPQPTDAADFNSLIAAARLARDSGQTFNPAGNNAIELFAAALAADPDNSIIAAELEAVISQALGLAESAMLEFRLDETNSALQRVAAVDPQNARLPFLSAQLTQMQLRARLDEARVAIRENRFEDAATEVSAARGLNVSDTTEIGTVAAELSTARSEQQLDDLLTKAAARLGAGELLNPANDNARYYYELVLSNNADNTAASQGLSVIAGKLAFQARTEIDRGNLQAAEDILANARAVDSANSEVASTVAALASTRAAIVERRRRAEAEAERQAEADRQAEIERLAAADRQAEIERLAAAERQAELDRTADVEQQAAAAETAAADRQTETGNPSILEPAETNVAEPVAADTQTAIDTTGVPAAAQMEGVLNRRPAAVSSLSRLRYVAPKYPRGAARRNISGWVDVVFTVATDGSVKDVSARGSDPGETFVNSAIKAVEKWEFEPVLENGAIVERFVGVRMMFVHE